MFAKPPSYITLKLRQIFKTFVVFYLINRQIFLIKLLLVVLMITELSEKIAFDTTKFNRSINLLSSTRLFVSFSWKS